MKKLKWIFENKIQEIDNLENNEDIKKEIAKKLDLEYPYKNLIRNERGCGRTTDMLLNVLVKLKNGENVCIVGYDVKYVDCLVNKLKKYSDNLNINVENKIEAFDMYDFHDKREELSYYYGKDNIFIDHFCYEKFEIGEGFFK